MNSERLTKYDLACDRAERWFVRQAARPGSVDPAFEKWLQESPENQSAWSETVARWSRLGTVLRDGRLDDLVNGALEQDASATGRQQFSLLRRRLGKWLSRLWLHPPIFARAAVAMVVLAAVSVGAMSLYQPRAVHQTTDSEQQILLRDGTRVHLDFNSRIEVSIGWRGRDVNLVRGRALFDIAHENERAFTVHAGSATVVATGTQFQIDRSRGAVRVSLLSGGVRVDTEKDDRSYQLVPGERLTWDAGGNQWRESFIDPEVVTAWTRGFLEFDHTPLKEAIDEVNRYAVTKVYLADPELAALEVSGNFERGDAQRFAKALPHVLPVKVILQRDRIVIARK